MKTALTVISNMFAHFYRNRSNYLLLTGICCILSYVYSNYGFQTSLLLIGVLLVITSIIIELNASSNKK